MKFTHKFHCKFDDSCRVTMFFDSEKIIASKGKVVENQMLFRGTFTEKMLPQYIDWIESSYKTLCEELGEPLAYMICPGMKPLVSFDFEPGKPTVRTNYDKFGKPITN